MKTPLKILMLEDSETDAEMIQRLLKKEKLDCEFALTMTKEGYLNALEKFKPDMILSDNSMPQFSAKEALGIINKSAAHVPFIMVTGTVSEEFAADIIKMGAADYILKDRLTRLPAAIDTALKHRKAEKDKQETEKKIIQSENNLRAIFENASEGFLLLDNNALIKAFNSKVKEYAIVTDSKQLQQGKSIFDFIEGSKTDMFKMFISKALKGEKSRYERAFEKKDGNNSWIDFSITPVMESGDVHGVCITARDITEKKLAEEQLERSFREKKALAERMSIILNTLSANIALLNENGIIVDINDAWRNFSNISGFIGSNYTIGDNYIDIAKKAGVTNEVDGKAVADGIVAVLKNEVAEFVFEYAAHSSQSKGWFRMIATPLQDKEYAGAVVMHIDISEIRKLEQERVESKVAEQKKITQAMLKGQEKERNYIGQELHDNINQILAGTKMYLSSAGKKNAEIHGLVKYPMELIDNSIAEIRILCQQLVTPFKDIFLDIMIPELLNALVKNKKIKTDFTYNVPDDLLSDDLKLNIYRIIQEQLNNIAKYAAAKNVSIILEAKNNIISIIIKDDGKGFDVKQKREGIGISNMINRAKSFNGSLLIKSKPGKGCEIQVKIPY